jgi:hypothetical protein
VPLLIDPGVDPVVVDPVIIDVDPIALPDAVALQVVEVALVEPGIAPPPSNVDIDPANPVADVVDPEQGFVPAVGLRPPVFNSVAPRGIPLGCDAALKSIVPSGEVAPMPGVGATCAKHGPQPIRQAAAARVIRYRIEASTDSAPQPATRQRIAPLVVQRSACRTLLEITSRFVGSRSGSARSLFETPL